MLLMVRGDVGKAISMSFLLKEEAADGDDDLDKPTPLL